jgi:hypothetical protein
VELQLREEQVEAEDICRREQLIGGAGRGLVGVAERSVSPGFAAPPPWVTPVMPSVRVVAKCSTPMSPEASMTTEK